MANPIPNEEAIFKTIERDHITMDPVLLDLLYHYIGDDITGINLVCQYYLDSKEYIPFEHSKMLQLYLNDISMIIKNITRFKQEDPLFPQFKNMVPLHPLIRDLITYHFGNDIYVISLILEEAIGESAKNPRHLALEEVGKILQHAYSIQVFLEKLRLATTAPA